jgi:hypothetical protein
MLWTVFVAMLVGWLVMVVSRHTFGGWAHGLFAGAVVLGLIQILWRREVI